MNKLLLVAILGFVVLSLTAAAEEESKSEIAAEAGTELEAVANAEIDENLADPESRKRRRNNPKKSKGQKKGKRAKGGKAKKNKGNKKIKNRRRKKARRNKNNKKKANKKRNKQRNAKSRRIRNKKKGGPRQESCGCAVNIWKYRDVMVKYGNYEKQFKRITKFKGLGEKKLAKKGGFEKGATYLKESGGGDADNLTCNGASTNTAAKQVKNLTNYIENCSNHINNVCNVSMPKPPPENETKPCTDAIASFKAIMTNCTKDKLDGAKLCTCVGNKALPNLTETINKCDLSKTYLKKFVSYKGACIKAFGDCRKYEDEIGAAVATCGKDPKKELVKLLNTKANTDGAKKVQTKIEAVQKAAGRNVRSARASVSVTCAVFAINVSDYTKKFQARPDRPDIKDMAATIANSTVAKCTTADLGSLKATVTMIVKVIATVEVYIAQQQTALEQLTGSTASSAVLASASAAEVAAAATTAAAAGRKRAAHANLLRRLREVKS